MAYRIFPDGTPPIHPYAWNSGSYSSIYNHHIADESMPVDKYSLNQGIGRELSCLLNWANAHNIGMPDKIIQSGRFYNIGYSGISDWFDSASACQHIYVKSGYINNYYPMTVSYNNLIISGFNLYVSNFIKGNPTLNANFSGYLYNYDETNFINNQTAYINLISGTYFDISLDSGVFNVYKTYQNDIYPVMKFGGAITSDYIDISGNIINSGLYISPGTGIPGDWNSIIYNPTSGHYHVGSGNTGTKITLYEIISSNLWWDGLYSGIIKNIKNSEINISGYNPTIYETVHKTYYDDFGNQIYVNPNFVIYYYYDTHQIINWKNNLFKLYGMNDTYLHVVTDSYQYHSDYLYNHNSFARPELIRGEFTLPCNYYSYYGYLLPKIIYMDVDYNYTITTALNIDEDNSWPTINGCIHPDFIIDYKEKVWIFGRQWNEVPKIIYADNIRSSVWYSFDPDNIQDITMYLKQPIIYKNELYFADYANNIYKIIDHNTPLQYILSSAPNNIRTYTISDSSTDSSRTRRGCYFNNKLYKNNLFSTNLGYYNNEDFIKADWVENDGKNSCASFKDDLFITGDSGNVFSNVTCYNRGENYNDGWTYFLLDNNLSGFLQNFISEYGYWTYTYTYYYYYWYGGGQLFPVQWDLNTIYKNSLIGINTDLCSGYYLMNPLEAGKEWENFALPEGFVPTSLTNYNYKAYMAGYNITSGLTILYESDDFGASWVDKKHDIGGFENNYNNLTPFNSGLYLSFTNSGIYKWDSVTLTKKSDLWITASGEGYMQKYNNRLYFVRASGDGNSDLWYIDNNDTLTFVSGDICNGEAHFGLSVYNNKLIYGKPGSDSNIYVDNTQKNWQFYVNRPEITSGCYINYKDKLFGPIVFWISDSLSGYYINDFPEMRDAIILQGQLYYTDGNFNSYRFINNEHILDDCPVNSTDSERSVFRWGKWNNRLYGTFGDKFELNNEMNGGPHYKNLNTHDLFLDKYSEEI